MTKRGFYLAMAATAVWMNSCATVQTQTPIASAAARYAVNHSVVKTVSVVEQVSDGDYARAKVSPTDGTVTNPVWVFLKERDGSWTGLMLGTAFTPKDYRKFGIPRSLWLK